MQCFDSLALDVHVLISDDTPRAWVRQCLQSIEVAKLRSPIPIHVFTVAGHPGHIGMGRWKGYQLGNAPYVTYVDDDDYLEPLAFERVAQELIHNPDVVYPLERVWLNGRSTKGLQRHHLPVYRRCHIIDHRPYPCAGDVAQMEYVRDLRIVEIPEYLYNHRIYAESKARVLRRRYPHELKQCLQFPAANPSMTTESPL
jgi:hypothetical protein